MTDRENPESLPYLGPTVEEAARIRLIRIGEEIARLQEERQTVKVRLEKYRGSKMLESERIATRAEPLQVIPLPKG